MDFLRGKCRYCKQPISPEYPIVEAITGLLFVFYYVMFFMAHVGPEGTTNLADQWPIYGLYMRRGRAIGGEPDRCGTVHHSGGDSLVAGGHRDRGAWSGRSAGIGGC